MIHDINKARQVLDFKELCFGTACFTDIDAIIEYHNKVYVILESKYRSSELPLGQRLCLQRMVTDLSYSGKLVMAVVCEHEEDNSSLAINTGSCYVREIYEGRGKQWRPPRETITVRKCVELFLSKV